MHQLDVESVAERRYDLTGLVVPQQPVIDENAGQLLADRLVDQHRGDRRVHAARQPADHPSASYLRPNPGNLRRSECRHGPGPGQPNHVMGKVAQQLRAVRRVDDLRMKLHAVEVAPIIGDGGKRGRFTCRDNPEPGRQPSHPVPVAHPNLFASAFRPHPVKQRAVISDINIGAAEFPMSRRFNGAAELMAQQLLPIANPQDRNAQIEHLGGGEGRHRLMHRSRPPREDNPARMPCGDPARIGIERPDFAINPRVAQAAGDQLGDLAAEVQDQDAFGGIGGIRQGIGHDGGRQRLIPRLGPCGPRHCKPRTSGQECAPVHVQGLAGDVAPLGPDQKSHGCGNLLGCCLPPKRDSCEPLW